MTDSYSFTLNLLHRLVFCLFWWIYDALRAVADGLLVGTSVGFILWGVGRMALELGQFLVTIQITPTDSFFFGLYLVVAPAMVYMMNDCMEDLRSAWKESLR